jgi:hypothetical protein
VSAVLIGLIAVSALSAELWAANQRLSAANINLSLAYKAERIAKDNAKDSEAMAKASAVKATEMAARTRRTLNQLFVSNGLQRADAGDLFGALLWFAKPLEEDQALPTESVHLTRLSNYLRLNSKPKLVRSITFPDPVGNGALSSDCQVVLTASGKTARL